jgi:hypothetical protein
MSPMHPKNESESRKAHPSSTVAPTPTIATPSNAPFGSDPTFWVTVFGEISMKNVIIIELYWIWLDCHRSLNPSFAESIEKFSKGLPHSQVVEIDSTRPRVIHFPSGSRLPPDQSESRKLSDRGRGRANLSSREFWRQKLTVCTGQLKNCCK